MAGPLLVVDAPSILFRAFYALPTSIEDDSGKPVNALLGGANLILQEVEQHDPRAIVLCFGPDAAHYRVELYEGYHADRPEVPAELAPQFADAAPFYGAFGWEVATHNSLEADDLLGAYARAEVAGGGRALVMTGDRDMFQCAGERVTVLYVRTGSEAPSRSTPLGYASAMASRRSRCRTSSPYAATPPTAFPARRASARRPRPSCSTATARSMPS